MKKVKRLGTSFGMILIMACMMIAISTKAEAAYTYKVSFVIGGTEDVGASFIPDYDLYLKISNPDAKVTVADDCVTVTNLQYNDEIVFNPKDGVKIDKTDSESAKYYVKGCRRSGSNDASSKSAFAVTKDDSYVIAYGVGAVVPYEVRYLDAGNNTLAESVTYYGALGEEVYVPYKYIEGYTPKVNNYHIESLKENQVIEFKYDRATVPSGSTQYINDSRTEYSTVQGETSYIYQASDNNANPVPEGGVVNNRTNRTNTNQQNAVDQDSQEEENVEQIDDDSVPASREDVVDIPDEETAKSIFDAEAKREWVRRYSIVIAILGATLVIIFVIAAMKAERERKDAN